MTEGLVLLDSNVLVFAHSPKNPLFARALEIVESGTAGVRPYVVAEQNLLEWYSAVTSVRTRLDPVSPTLATVGIQHYRTSHLNVIQPNSGTWTIFERLIATRLVRGKDIFDCYLAATALSNGVDMILTDNTKDFAGIPGLTVINPFGTP